jgi:hypothetical protein
MKNSGIKIFINYKPMYEYRMIITAPYCIPHEQHKPLASTQRPSTDAWSLNGADAYITSLTMCL